MEILAPCGSPDHVKAAVYAGADAIYLGGHAFSARRNAANFSVGEIQEAVRFCHGFGVKLYVTVNILTRDKEWDALSLYLAELANAAPDALIVQDMGVARLCRSQYPDLPLHASTQLSVHSEAGVRFCKEAGFSRVVVARECDKDTLTQIINGSEIGIEMFVHGALCVSVSGQCGLSAIIGGRSGNRGLCAQPCRLDYTHGEHHYALSLKDLSLIREIPLLEKMGVSALKIEGRMKRPEYVTAAIRACRSALAGEEVRYDELRAVFSRDGFTQGYFYNRPQGMKGVRSPIDTLETAAVLPRLAELSRFPTRRVPVECRFVMRDGQESRLSVTDGTDEITVWGDVPTAGLRRGTTEEEAVKRLSRMGDTPFMATDVQTDIEPGISLTAAQINALRRNACEKLLARRVERLSPVYRPVIGGVEVSSEISQLVESDRFVEPFLRVHCQTIEQAWVVLAEAEQIVLGIEEAETALRTGFPTEKMIVAPERFIIDEEQLKQKLLSLKSGGAERLLCQNPAHAVLGREMGYALHGGLGLNVFNSTAAAFWQACGLRDLTLSAELRLKECLSIKGGIPAGLVAYGRLPLMLLRRCPFERACTTEGSCPCFLSDRTNRRFPVACHGGYQELLNADCLWMADKLPKLRKTGFLSLLMFDESPEETLDVLRAYRSGGAPPEGFTRGLFSRGVE